MIPAGFVFERIAMPLFTVIAEFEGETHISQVRGVSAPFVVVPWAEGIDPVEWTDLSEQNKADLVQELSEKDPPCVPVEKTKNVWAAHASVNGRPVLAHLVQTVVV